MTSSQHQTFAASGTITNMMNQHVYQAYNPQQSQGFYDSFSIGPSHMQQSQRGMQQSYPNGLITNAPHQQPNTQHHHQQQHQRHHQQVQQVPSPVLSLPPGSRSTSRQDSAEYDEDSEDDDEEEEEDTSEVMIPNDDIETRLKVAQEAQDAAASEGSNGVFACPYCDKRYNGKHARSIWRRHLQDKHAIPLSQQPRRTRWDGDANRPKNAEERRQRMLESKRRWARKKRQAEKVGGSGGNGGSGVGGAKLLSANTREDSFSGDVSASENSSFSEPPKKVSSQASNASKAKRQQKTKEPRPLKFHNITQGSMPPFADFGSKGNSGGGGMLWPTSGNGAFQNFGAPHPGNGNSNTSKANINHTTAARSQNGNMPPTTYTFHNSNSFVMAQQQQQQQAQRQQQQTIKMAVPASKSPRKALSQIDSNSLIGRKLVRQSMDGNGQNEGFMLKSQLKVDSPQMNTRDLNRMTPLNRFNQAYPTPPSAGDSINNDKKMFNNKMMPSFDGSLNGMHHGNMPLISPPASQHTNDSSPSYNNVNAINMTSLGMRNGSNPIYAPIHNHDSKMQRSPSQNPFSLDRHKISPSTSTTRNVLTDTMQPPMSASRLTSVMENHEHRLSPIQRRRTSDEEGHGIISPKSRKLPPLVKTPLRALKMDENPTPSTFLDLSGMAGASTIRRLRSAGPLQQADPWKGMMTPSEEISDRMIGFTPLTIKTGRYSTARGLASISRPKRDNDQFSSPQHLNLTQSLGLAPHSTTKGGVYSSINATPYVGHFMSTNSPWPESVVRPMATAGVKRGRQDASSNGQTRSERGDEEDDDDDDEEENNGVYVHETPSRPAKHHRSTLLGSAGRRGSDDGSSPRATRSGRLASSSGVMKPLSFTLSNDREGKVEEEPRNEGEIKGESNGEEGAANSTSPSPARSGVKEESKDPDAVKVEN